MKSWLSHEGPLSNITGILLPVFVYAWLHLSIFFPGHYHPRQDPEELESEASNCENGENTTYRHPDD